MELGVLEIVLWVAGAVHHPAGAAGGRSKLLLACVLTGRTQTVIKHSKSRQLKQQLLRQFHTDAGKQTNNTHND